jgi:NarL family two-component system response regulator LiaR
MIATRLGCWRISLPNPYTRVDGTADRTAPWPPRAQGAVLLFAIAGRAALRKRRTIPSGCTERETAVLRLLAEGLANKQIATELMISENTVRTHVSSILAKLGMQSRTQAALYAAQIGLAKLV